MSFIFTQVLGLPKDFLRQDEVALAFGVHRRTVQRWMEEGKLSHITTPGGQRRILRESLIAASPNFFPLQ